MSEHSPAPTPGRAVYGFAVFLLFKTLFIIYVFWAFVPQRFIEETLGLTYLPNKYFAVMVPMLILTGFTCFIFGIYPILGLAQTPAIDNISTIRDRYTIRRCEFKDLANNKCNNKIEEWLQNGFEVSRFCAQHCEQDPATPVYNNQVDDFCDCLDEDSCLLKTQPDYLEQLRTRKTVPSAADLDISDVCRQLYL